MKRLLEWGESLSEGKLGSLNAAIAFVVIYFICQIVVLSLVSHFAGTGVSIDDAEQLIYVTRLSAGYGGSQPPLFTWINWLATHLLGIDVVTLKIVKYLVLFLAFASVYRAMRLLGYPRRTAATAMLGLFTIAQIVWEMQHALTHSVASLAFSALAFLALANLLTRRDAASYLLFGAAAALAILAKFNDVIFLLAMLAAALSLSTYRSVIVDRRVLLSLLVLVIMLLPTVLWSIEHHHAVFARIHKFGLDPRGDSFLFIRAKGLVEFALATFDFAIMTVLACGLACASQKVNPARRIADTDAPDRFLGRLLLIGYAITVVLVLMSGTTAVRDRWLLPLLFLLPAYFAVRMERIAFKGRSVQYALTLLAAAIAIGIMPASWYIQAWGGQGKSQIARLDYPALFGDLRADGPVKTIVSSTSWVGNFRLVDKDLVLLNQEVPGFDRLIQQPALLVWLGDGAPPALVLQRLRESGYAPAGTVQRFTAPFKFLPEPGMKISSTRLKPVAATMN